jgi:drug/metabolite transporter (DMT)-like permease
VSPDEATHATKARSIAARLPPGLALGTVAVVLFSFSFPATKLAVGGLDPIFISFGRAVVAGALSIAVLAATRAPTPTAEQWRGLAIVAGGVVIGFPVLTAIALEAKTSAHVAVVTAVMPAATAVMAMLRAGERPSVAFWLAALAGMVLVLVFAVIQGAGHLESDDALLLAAVALVGIGYAEGGAVSRDLGGTRTICWALVLSLPLTIVVTAVVATTSKFGDVEADAWLGFAYVSLVSMFIAFFAWYAGLARGGVAKIGQVQLAMPILTLGWAAFLLGERVTVGTVATAVGVLACVVATQRAGVEPAPGD